jgi:hypothetical protein
MKELKCSYQHVSLITKVQVSENSRNEDHALDHMVIHTRRNLKSTVAEESHN